MVSDRLDACYSIATLPNPLDSKLGKVCAAPVYGLRGSRKRKRHEVAVGIDGEGVNVYDAQTQNLITSHALPPQSYLGCPPTSVFCKIPSSGTSQRRTYLVLRNGPQDSQYRLFCFTEEVRRPNGLDEQLSEPVKSQCKLRNGEVLSVDAVPRGSADGDLPSLDVVVTYRNGNVDCISGDLSKTVWKHDTNAEKSSVVEYTAVFDRETAQKGLLQNRGDALAALDTGILTSAGEDSTQLLLHLTRLKSKVYLELFAIRNVARDEITSRRPSLQSVLNYELPQNRPIAGPINFHFHAASGTIYQLVDGKLDIYDLTATVPRIQTELGSRNQPVSSFARVSSLAILVVVGTKARVYETKFGSDMETIDLNDDYEQSTESKKRKRSDNEERSVYLKDMAYFSNLAVAVGITANKLMVLPITMGDRAKINQKRETLLISAMGKGIPVNVAGPPFESTKAEKKAKKYDEWKTEVDEAVRKNDGVELERLAAESLRLRKDRSGQEAEDSTPLDATAFDQHEIDRRRAFYLLSHALRAATEDEVANETRLVITTKSENLLKWFALTGLLKTTTVQKAIRDSSPQQEPQQNLLPGDVMRAVRSFDLNFQLMHDMLALPVHWEIEEVIQALKLLVQSFETSDDGAGQLALPGPSVPSKGEDTTMVNGGAERDVASESRAAETELDHAMSTLFSGLQIRSDALRMTLTRLHAFPQKTVATTMRASMTRKEIIFFIHILRLELADGGWTTRYADVGDDQFENSVPGATDIDRDGPSNQAIRAISDMLNCAVDAIGISGWLVGLSGDLLGTEELVHALRAEVSAGVEGCYEADTLHTVLSELDKYASSLPAPQAINPETEAVEMEDTALPVSCRVNVPATRTKNGKEVKKSRHMLAREKSMRVGKYSIDRIRI